MILLASSLIDFFSVILDVDGAALQATKASRSSAQQLLRCIVQLSKYEVGIEVELELMKQDGLSGFLKEFTTDREMGIGQADDEIVAFACEMVRAIRCVGELRCVIKQRPRYCVIARSHIARVYRLREELAES